MRADRPSSTTILIARSILLSAHDPMRVRLIAPGELERTQRMLEEAGSAGWFDFAVAHGPTRWLLGRAEEALSPGMFTHYLARKRWIEQRVRAAVGNGARQVVVLGAGFDTLGWRLAGEEPGVSIVEIDHPATQAPKRKAVGRDAPITFLEADLAQTSLARILNDCPAWSPRLPTVFLAEGLLMYFPERTVVALFDAIAALARARTDVLFSFMERGKNGSLAFRDERVAVRWWLRMRQEPFLWGLDCSAIRGFVEARGFRLDAVAACESLRSEVLAPRGVGDLRLARGESLCHCSRETP